MWFSKKITFWFVCSTIFIQNIKINSFIPGNNNEMFSNNKKIESNSSFEFEKMESPFYLPILSYKEKDNGRFQIEQNLNFNFTNIGGYKSVKKELLQMKDIFLNNRKYKRYNVRMPKGVLLEGPPGNGKTLMAKCFAGECGVSFISVIITVTDTSTHFPLTLNNVLVS